MPDNIEDMRSDLNRHVAPRFAGSITREAIGESYDFMRSKDALLNDRLRSRCLIPRNDGSGDAVVDCTRPTTFCHTIQRAVLESISSGSPAQVLNFVPIDTQRIANLSKDRTGVLWAKPPWDIQGLTAKLETPASASTRHFACNSCDSTTFREIEHDPITWPKWPEYLVINEVDSNDSDSLLSRQMFLLAYRCLLQHISQIRGLLAATDYSLANDTRLDDHRRDILAERMVKLPNLLSKVEIQKSKYDRRLVGVGEFPMVHYISAIRPAFPLASVSLAPVPIPGLLRHTSITVYPDRVPIKRGPADWNHWMVLSIPFAHEWASRQYIQAKVESAKQTNNDVDWSVRWTTEYLARDGFLSTYCRPESFHRFQNDFPDEADRILRTLHNDIVATSHETYL